MALKCPWLLRLALVLSVLLVAMAAGVADAANCPDSGLAAPAVSTLMVSTSNDSAAWVLRDDCSVDELSVIMDPYDSRGKLTLLNATLQDIAIVESLPPASRVFLVSNSKLESADFSGHTEIVHLLLSSCMLQSLDNIVLPTAVIELDLNNNPLVGIAEDEIPASVQYLYLNGNKLTSLKNFSIPNTVEHLYLLQNKFEQLDDTLPSGLVGMYMDGNPLQQLENVTFPDSMVNFSCVGCSIKSIRGVEFSYQLDWLNLEDNRILEFEIRESDIDVFKKMENFQGEISQSKCKEATAEELEISDGNVVCVISDALFETKYRSSGSSSSVPSTTPTPTTSGPTTSGPPTSAPAAGADTAAEASSSSNGTIIITVCIIAAVVIIVIALIVYRAKTRPKDKLDNEFHTLEMTGTAGHSSQEYLSNDVRNDPEMITFRITRSEIKLGRQIAKGGFGIVSMAMFHNETVAVKQLRPEKSRTNSVIMSFMDEIRMCAKLEHPKIVRFIGVAWSNLLDISVVTEYMAGGDLTTVLHAHTNWEPRDWYEPSERLNAKALVAMDIVEALVYLHSFESPVLHRDLKTRNVLLADDGTAKLSDFGISRELSMDETMTGEVGTVAWIAPEVLQGERYSEKADIYSFGVVLVELDTGTRPYDKDVDSEDDSQIPSSHTNTRIAMLVSAGALKPSLSKNCPREIRNLAMRCMNFEAASRPSAVEIHYELREIQKKWAGSAAY